MLLYLVFRFPVGLTMNTHIITLSRFPLGLTIDNFAQVPLGADHEQYIIQYSRFPLGLTVITCIANIISTLRASWVYHFYGFTLS